MKLREDKVIMIVDKETGDITKVDKVDVNRNYVMLFWDIGEELAKGEKSSLALQVFLSLIHRVEYNTGRTYMGPELRGTLMETHQIDKAQLSRALKILKDRDMILTTSDNHTIINPMLAWKGSMSERERLINHPKVTIPITSKEW